MNQKLSLSVMDEAVKTGVEVFCVCPGGRCAPFVYALENSSYEQYYWFEERSCAFFALGKSKREEKPVAVITTSGTAASELLPAAIEAYYSGIPLLLITADRPKSFRGSGAPQTIEQKGLFEPYACFSQDIDESELCDLREWTKKGPAHVNVCFSEPLV